MFPTATRIRSRQSRSLLLSTLAAMQLAFGCVAAPVNTSSPALPKEVLALVAPSDTVLAYKSADLYGDGKQAAVIVIRHQVSGRSDYDFANNPCELAVLREDNGKLIESARSAKAVDCTYNDAAGNAPAMSLNDNLTATVGNIVYVSQKEKGDSTLHFAWSKEKTRGICSARPPRSPMATA